MQSVQEAASLLGVSVDTVRRRVKRGQLRGWRENGRLVVDLEAANLHMQNGQNAYAGAYADYVAVLEAQLAEKDQQIRELHVLLQGFQGQRSLPGAGGTSWWKFWKRGDR